VRHLKELRERKGLSQRELAAATGRDQTYISELERSDVVPKLETLADFARALSCRIEDLIPSTIYDRASRPG
jgi:transcriptional regulator with XRE-family HTH domain